jgi:hypothetical protein
MSTAFFIVLDDEESNDQEYVNGNSLAHFAELDSVLKKLEIKDIFEYVQFNEFLFDELDGGAADVPEIEWYDAQEGIDYFVKIKGYLKENGHEYGNTKDVVSDLDDYIDVLKKAKSKNAKWHLQIDY